MRVGVWGLGVWGLGVWGFSGLGFRVWGLGVQGLGLEFGVWGSGSRIQAIVDSGTTPEVFLIAFADSGAAGRQEP